MSSVSHQRLLSGRRLALLASAAGLSAVLVFGNAGLAPPSLIAPAQAQTAQRPVGFADIVEKVKPAVISVRVKMNAGPQNSEFSGADPFGPSSPFQYFFRRFGQEVPGMRNGAFFPPAASSFLPPRLSASAPLRLSLPPA